ncbi:hypothetical protein [Candidatus Electronema sp. TJ]|uniref:hypothetical protein n=1 Tax=Candidatus Electronema sp. TJ TaxID=3401573 RepID=UPI003AA93A93
MSVRHAVLGMLFLAALPSLSHASCAAPTDLNAVWKADDGGLYYVRQVGNEVWWVGMSADEGRTWTNVFRGTRNGATVVGKWADVPRGGAKANGMLKLAVQENNGAVAGFTRTEVTGGFGGSAWHLNCNDVVLVPVNE